jgi:hypothetical protein
LKSPTLILFIAYLVVAGLVSPTGEGESASPLLGLAVAIPLAYVAATFSALGSAAPRPLIAVGLALLHAAALAAAAAIVLALLSPAFVPTWLR